MAATPRLLGLGDNVVDRYPASGLMFPGGSACNFAVHARRRGAYSAYIGAVSSDVEGALVMSALAMEGVDTSHVTRYDGPESHAVVHVNDEGNREFLDWLPGPAPRLSEDDREFLSGFDLVHTGHSSRSEELVQSLSRLLPISFDFSYQRGDYVNALLPFVSTAIFSGAQLTVAESEVLARDARSRGPELVVVTRGPHEAVLLKGNDLFLQPADLNFDVRDTLGAGDAFVASLLTSILREVDLESAAALAATYAAVVCTYDGGFGYPAALNKEGGSLG
jgi:fructoselysine 6-kinase